MGGGGRVVTVMLMQFVPPPPTVQQEYTNMMLTMIIRMRVGTRMEETKIKVILKTENRIESLPEGCPSSPFEPISALPPSLVPKHLYLEI